MEERWVKDNTLGTSMLEIAIKFQKHFINAAQDFKKAVFFNSLTDENRLTVSAFVIFGLIVAGRIYFGGDKIPILLATDLIHFSLLQLIAYFSLCFIFFVGSINASKHILLLYIATSEALTYFGLITTLYVVILIEPSFADVFKGNLDEIPLFSEAMRKYCEINPQIENHHQTYLDALAYTKHPYIFDQHYTQEGIINAYKSLIDSQVKVESLLQEYYSSSSEIDTNTAILILLAVSLTLLFAQFYMIVGIFRSLRDVTHAWLRPLLTISCYIFSCFCSLLFIFGPITNAWSNNRYSDYEIEKRGDLTAYIELENMLYYRVWKTINKPTESAAKCESGLEPAPQ